jgi:hypothetical protein
MKFQISSNRVAYHLNQIHETKKYTKGEWVKCLDIANILITDIDKELKKVFFNEILDMCDDPDIHKFFVEHNKNEDIKELVEELKTEIESGDAERKEKEFDELHAKIEHRRKIIGDI